MTTHGEANPTYEWVAKVIESCKTQEQLDGATKVAIRFYDMYISTPDSNDSVFLTLLFMASPLMGLIKKKKESFKI